MTTEPYASADNVFWIAGNGSSRRGAASARRMTAAWPNAHLVHLPAHASWLDQAEIYFSVVQRKVLTPSDFTDLDQTRDRLAAFEIRCNAIARPFKEVHPHRSRRPAPPDRRHDRTQPRARAA